MYDFNIDSFMIDCIKSSNNDVLIINLYKLYKNKQFEVGKNIFNINDKNKYFPLKYGNLCFMTSFAKLNVIIWLIQIGFYKTNICN